MTLSFISKNSLDSDLLSFRLPLDHLLMRFSDPFLFLVLALNVSAVIVLDVGILFISLHKLLSSLNIFCISPGKLFLRLAQTLMTLICFAFGFTFSNFDFVSLTFSTLYLSLLVNVLILICVSLIGSLL